MKKLTCEMCGNNDLIKKDGVFECQFCGTKYSIEEAKRMILEGTVDIKGTVKVDTTDELSNLYEIARRAKDSDNYENAAKYYDMILIKDPNSWEANFYVVYFKAMSCKIAGIWNAANSLTNCINPVLQLVKENITNPDELGEVINELKLRFAIAANMLANAAKRHYDGIDQQIKANYTQEYLNNSSECVEMLYQCGNGFEIYFEGKYGDASVYVWKNGINIHNQYLPYLADIEGNKKIMIEYANKIRKYDTSYQINQFNEPNNSSGGCYIATAVYGSYDCPQVWTLRRYRDYILAATWLGRAFVRSYYAISPTLVKWFGKTTWFKHIGKYFLDIKVQKLNERGITNTQYCDRQW